jgi:iron complex outermembrane receptor protein
MNNIEHNVGKLKAYSFSNLQLQYNYQPKKIAKEIIFKAIINNIFDEKFESNGYFYTYDDDWTNPGRITTIAGSGFYPQAGIHFLTGITLKL